MLNQRAKGNAALKYMTSCLVCSFAIRIVNEDKCECEFDCVAYLKARASGRRNAIDTEL